MAADDAQFRARVQRTFDELDTRRAGAINYVQLRRWIASQMKGGFTDEAQKAATDAFAAHKRESDDLLGVDEIASLLRELDLVKYLDHEPRVVGPERTAVNDASSTETAVDDGAKEAAAEAARLLQEEKERHASTKRGLAAEEAARAEADRAAAAAAATAAAAAEEMAGRLERERQARADAESQLADEQAKRGASDAAAEAAAAAAAKELAAVQQEAAAERQRLRRELEALQRLVAEKKAGIHAAAQTDLPPTRSSADQTDAAGAASADAGTQSEGEQVVMRSGVAQTDAGPALVDAATQADRIEDDAAKSAGDHEAALRCFLKGREAEVKAKEAEKLAEQKQQDALQAAAKLEAERQRIGIAQEGLLARKRQVLERMEETEKKVVAMDARQKQLAAERPGRQSDDQMRIEAADAAAAAREQRVAAAAQIEALDAEYDQLERRKRAQGAATPEPEPEPEPEPRRPARGEVYLSVNIRFDQIFEAASIRKDAATAATLRQRAAAEPSADDAKRRAHRLLSVGAELHGDAAADADHQRSQHSDAASLIGGGMLDEELVKAIQDDLAHVLTEVWAHPTNRIRPWHVRVVSLTPLPSADDADEPEEESDSLRLYELSLSVVLPRGVEPERVQDVICEEVAGADSAWRRAAPPFYSIDPGYITGGGEGSRPASPPPLVQTEGAVGAFARSCHGHGQRSCAVCDAAAGSAGEAADGATTTAAPKPQPPALRPRPSATPTQHAEAAGAALEASESGSEEASGSGSDFVSGSESGTESEEEAPTPPPSDPATRAFAGALDAGQSVDEACAEGLRVIGCMLSDGGVPAAAVAALKAQALRGFREARGQGAAPLDAWRKAGEAAEAAASPR